MADAKWPFGPTDGGPLTRPLVVDMENILVAILADSAHAERARDVVRALGVPDDHLRMYTSEQILAFDESFQANRSLLGKLVGTVVDDRGAMAAYLAYAREGRASLWVLVADRDDAKRVIRRLADHETLHIWYHGPDGVETLHMG